MCIIVAKNKGVKLPSRATLRECFKNNKDGLDFKLIGFKKINNIKNIEIRIKTI